MARYLLNPLAEAERIVQERGEWIVAAVDPRISWPTQKQVVQYSDVEFVLFPQSQDDSAAVGLRADQYGISADEARKWIMRFCSALCWAEGGGIEIVTWSGGSLPYRVGKPKWGSVTHFLEAEHLPRVNSDEDKAALAFFREGLSLNNPFYAFLSLFKSISVVVPDGKQRAEWIDAAIAGLDDHRAKERRDQLIADGQNVGQYIWKEGRNAIAHAEKIPYVNPDDTDDHFRLYQDIPLLKNLAELSIEQLRGIRRSHTIWKEHLYELQGFRRLISEDLLKMLESSEPVPEGTTVDLPDRYSVLAKRGPDIDAFKDMRLEIVAQVEGGVAVALVSNDDAVRIRAVLNFAQERFQFDPIHGIGFTPNRKEKKNVRNEIAVLKFQRCILRNGHLEVWDQETETILGRSEPYIPRNFLVNHEFYTNEIAELEDILNG